MYSRFMPYISYPETPLLLYKGLPATRRYSIKTKQNSTLLDVIRRIMSKATAASGPIPTYTSVFGPSVHGVMLNPLTARLKTVQFPGYPEHDIQTKKNP